MRTLFRCLISDLNAVEEEVVEMALDLAHNDLYKTSLTKFQKIAVVDRLNNIVRIAQNAVKTAREF